jgi:hypothetical protein
MKRTLSAAAVLPLVAVLIGCGGDGGKQGAAATPAANRNDAMLKYARCLRQNGLDVPDPTPGRGLRIDAANPSKVHAAMQTCRQFNPKPEGAGQNPKDLDRLLKIARCMRGRGIAVDDPQPGQPFTIREEDKSDQEVSQVEQECKRQVEPSAGPK